MTDAVDDGIRLPDGHAEIRSRSAWSRAGDVMRVRGPADYGLIAAGAVVGGLLGGWLGVGIGIAATPVALGFARGLAGGIVRRRAAPSAAPRGAWWRHAPDVDLAQDVVERLAETWGGGAKDDPILIDDAANGLGAAATELGRRCLEDPQGGDPNPGLSWLWCGACLGDPMGAERLSAELGRRGLAREAEEWRARAGILHATAEAAIDDVQAGWSDLPEVREALRTWIVEPRAGSPDGAAEALSSIVPPPLKEDGDERLEIRAISGDGRAAADLGRSWLKRDGIRAHDDVGRSWLWVGARLGDADAAEALARLLQDDGNASLAAKWRSLAAGPEAAATAVPKPEAWTGPTHLVVKGGILPEPERDDRVGIKRYACLTHPLPLLGGGDPDALSREVDAAFPWMKKATDRIVEDLHLVRNAGLRHHWHRPILVVGPKGIAKSSWAKAIARAGGVQATVVGLGGSSDSRTISGTARGWMGTTPALPVVACMRTKSANPTVVCDEIEKASPNRHNGSAFDALLQFLENETAAAFHDECLIADCDLTKVCWILTANSTTELPEHFRSRVRIVKVDPPKVEHLDAALAHLRASVAKELGMPNPLMLPKLDGEDHELLRKVLAKSKDLRKLRSAFERLISMRERIAREALPN